MDMAAPTQRARGKRRRDIHGIQILRQAVFQQDAAPMVKIILPGCIRVFRAVDKHILFFMRINRYDPDMRALSGAVKHVDLPRRDINAFDGFSGKEGAGRANVKRQPLAVWRPGVDISELVMTGSESELLHKLALQIA